MSIIARTLDNERLSYEGSVYIRIPEGVEAEDAVVVDRNLDARYAKIGGELDARGVKIGGNLDASDAKIV